MVALHLKYIYMIRPNLNHCCMTDASYADGILTLAGRGQCGLLQPTITREGIVMWHCF